MRKAASQLRTAPSDLRYACDWTPSSYPNVGRVWYVHVDGLFVCLYVTAEVYSLLAASLFLNHHPLINQSLHYSAAWPVSSPVSSINSILDTPFTFIGSASLSFNFYNKSSSLSITN